MGALEGPDDFHPGRSTKAVITVGSHNVKRSSQMIKEMAGESLGLKSDGGARSRSWWMYRAPPNTCKGKRLITCLLKEASEADVVCRTVWGQEPFPSKKTK